MFNKSLKMKKYFEVKAVNFQLLNYNKLTNIR